MKPDLRLIQNEPRVYLPRPLIDAPSPPTAMFTEGELIFACWLAALAGVAITVIGAWIWGMML